MKKIRRDWDNSILAVEAYHELGQRIYNHTLVSEASV